MAKEEKKEVKKPAKKTTSKKTDNKKKEVKKEKKQGYFKGVKQEVFKVKWPAAKEVVKYTLATIVFCLFLGFFFEILNLLFSFIKGLFS